MLTIFLRACSQVSQNVRYRTKAREVVWRKAKRVCIDVIMSILYKLEFCLNFPRLPFWYPIGARISELHCSGYCNLFPFRGCGESGDVDPWSLVEMHIGGESHHNRVTE
jgi:hypothetical protein